MPIIIDEVVISVEVTGQTGGGASSGTQDKQEMVSECVERVLDILRQKEER